MTGPGQFGSDKGQRKPVDCAAVEAWLAEFAEQKIPAEIADQLRHHAEACPACNEKLTYARRGHEWLQVLQQEAPEPPSDLIAKILVKTSLSGLPVGLGADEVSTGTHSTPVHDEFRAEPLHWTRLKNAEAAGKPAASIPFRQRPAVVLLRRTMLEPRLALVAAMAFFSISLTLNLIGVRFDTLHAGDLAPVNIRRTITRQYADANARVVRYYENLRVVYEVEARVQQIRRASEDTTPPQAPPKPRKQSWNLRPESHGRKQPGYNSANGHSFPNSIPVWTGPRMEVELPPVIHRRGLEQFEPFSQYLQERRFA